MYDLTARQYEIMKLIYELARDKAMQPTYREMMKEFGIRSPNGIMCHMTALERKGYMEITGAHHGVTILKKPDGTPFSGFAEKVADQPCACEPVIVAGKLSALFLEDESA